MSTRLTGKGLCILYERNTAPASKRAHLQPARRRDVMCARRGSVRAGAQLRAGGTQTEPPCRCKWAVLCGYYQLASRLANRWANTPVSDPESPSGSGSCSSFGSFLCQLLALCFSARFFLFVCFLGDWVYGGRIGESRKINELTSKIK